MPAGYSGTPLVKKLGLRPGQRIRLINPPDDYAATLDPMPDGIVIAPSTRGRLDVVHLFTASRAELERRIPALRKAIDPDGMIWVSWPKKSSGVVSDVTEDVIRAIALPTGLVDVKVCAVDATWSGLKLVIRRELRPG